MIDDDEAIRRLVEDLLRDEGYRVTCEPDGARGLAALDRVEPALIVLDLNMPVMDGGTFLRVLRERGYQVPVVVITATRAPPSLGVERVIRKPFDLDDLADAVSRLVDSR